MRRRWRSRSRYTSGTDGPLSTGREARMHSAVITIGIPAPDDYVTPIASYDLVMSAVSSSDYRMGLPIIVSDYKQGEVAA
ncbi:hypothetical protein [Sphingobium scionense]|uniref:Uncharacterized protein n=2 Tax=Sphingobium scionense TaxID=1404341 RepID=A0A7W6PYB1_9SPHN|nr:hypothetical protein [Sphingobium scionense]